MSERRTLRWRLARAWRRGAAVSDRMASPERARQIAEAISYRWGRSL